MSGPPDSSPLSRRTFIATGFTIGSGLLSGVAISESRAETPGHHHHHQDEPTAGVSQWASFKPGAPFVEPEVRKSANGVLSTNLRCAYAYRDTGGYRLYLRSFEGGSPGPTLRVKPGDVLKIKLINDLPPNRDVMPSNITIPHQFNRTNFHSHGLHVDPGGISDNVMRSMEPGKSYDIEIKIPANHPPGTNWYHPHAHGSANIQVASGMVGALIIEGDFADIPEITAAKELLLMMGVAVFDSYGMIEEFGTVFSETSPRFFTINGVREPTITMRPGEVQRWRMVGSQWQDDIHLELEGHELHQIARDGIPLSRMDLIPPTNAASVKEKLQGTLLGPGQRLDFLVQAGKPGTYELRALPYNQGYPSPTGPIARLVVEGEPMNMSLPTKLSAPLHKPIADAEITGTRNLTFSAKVPEAEGAANWREFKFLIDGKPFDPNRVDQRIKLGAVEEWTVRNLHQHDHIFHIHTNDFLLTQVNGVALPEPIWMDTAVLPRFGSITIRSRFEDFTGVFMLHCHMMNHEELGMMQTVEVYAEDPAAPAEPHSH